MAKNTRTTFDNDKYNTYMYVLYELFFINTVVHQLSCVNMCACHAHFTINLLTYFTTIISQLIADDMSSVLWCSWLGSRKGIRPVKTEWWVAGMVICLERDADLHMAQLIPLPLTVSCFSKIQIGFTFLVSAHLCSLKKGPLNGCVCVCVCVSVLTMYTLVQAVGTIWASASIAYGMLGPWGGVIS